MAKARDIIYLPISALVFVTINKNTVSWESTVPGGKVGSKHEDAAVGNFVPAEGTNQRRFPFIPSCTQMLSEVVSCPVFVVVLIISFLI